MKKLALLMLLVAPAAYGQTYIQDKGADTNNATGIATLTWSPAVGSGHFVVGISRDGITTCPPDTLDNTDNGVPASSFQTAVQFNDNITGGSCQAIVFASNVTGAPTTATLNVHDTGAAHTSLELAEFSGVAGGLDVADTGSINGSATSATTNTITTTGTTDLIVACMATAGGQGTSMTVAAGTGPLAWHMYTNVTVRTSCAYATGVSPGTYSAVFSWTGALPSETMIAAFSTSAPSGSVSTINWSGVHQSIQGFGASTAFVGTAANAYDSLLFGTLGYSLLRVAVPIGNGTCDGSPSAGCATGQDSVTDMQSCVTNGCSVWAYVSNPPGEYNGSGTFNCTTVPALNVSAYAAFSTYISNYIASLNTFESVPLYAIGVQNEPDLACSMPAANIDQFITQNLHPTLVTNGQTSTKIMMPESSLYSSLTQMAGTCMADSTCVTDTGIVAYHGYDNPVSQTDPYGNPPLFWETEVSNGPGNVGPTPTGCSVGIWCPTIGDALFWSNIVDNFLVGGGQAWHYFWYVDVDNAAIDPGGVTNANWALINPGQTVPISKRTYAIANWSKFVRPGWVRIDATHAPQTGVTVTAFKDPNSNQFAIVAVNSNATPANQIFSLTAFPVLPQGISPTVTSSTLNLVTQSAVTLSGTNFSYTLPAQSVTTFTAVNIASTIHYVDYVSGSDSNAGTSTASPWKHAPGMLGLTPNGASTGDGCASNCASYTPAAGDKIILKGGSTWPYTTAPWQFAQSGSASTSTYGCQGTGCIYVGNAVGAGLPAWNSGTVTGIWVSKDYGGWSPSSPPTISCTGTATASLNVVPAAETNDPQIAGMIYKVTLTSAGSGYSSAPACSFSGGSGVGTLGTSIDQPIFDLGNGSAIVWPMGQCTTHPTTCWSGIQINGNFVIFNGINIQNLRMAQNTFGGGDDSHTTMVGMLGLNDTVSNSFIHGLYVDCFFSGSCNAGQDEQFDGIGIDAPHDEAAFDVVENGDSAFLGTAPQQAGNICNTNILCSTSSFGIATGTQTLLGPVSVHDSKIYGNGWQLRFVGNDASGSDPFLSYNNDFWLTTYEVNVTSHINSRYMQLRTPASLISYDNFDHNQVGGTSSQLECQSSVTLTYFNEAVWGIGTGTQPYSVDVTDAGGVGGCTLNLYNDSIYSNNSTNVCVNGNAATVTTTVVMQNLHCITTPSLLNPFWGTATNNVFKNSAGSTVAATVQASSVVQSFATASGQGYATSNAFAPTASGNDTVTFSGNANSANLTSLCTGNLATLCQDIRGNARPSVGGWQAGAYLFTGAGAPVASLSASTANLISNVGVTGNFAVTLTNTGSANLVISSVVLSGPGAYTMTNGCSGTLTPNSMCTTTVHFLPGAYGYSSATLTYTDNAVPSTQVVTINGNGVLNPPGPPPVTLAKKFDWRYFRMDDLKSLPLDFIALDSSPIDTVSGTGTITCACLDNDSAINSKR